MINFETLIHYAQFPSPLTVPFLVFSDVVGEVGVSVVDAATQSSSQVGVAPCHNLLEEVRRDNQQL